MNGLGKNFAREKLASLEVVGAKLRTPHKPLNTIE